MNNQENDKFLFDYNTGDTLSARSGDMGPSYY